VDLDLKAIRCFVVLAEELNFSRAAARLNLSQPALSSQIRVLERRLDLTLFQRTTRQVTVSEAGVKLLPAMQQLMATSRNAQSVIEALRGGPTRKLSFGAAFYTIDIPERVRLLETFFRQHPDVPLDVIPAWQREMVDDLRKGRLDIALLIGLPVARAQLERELTLEPSVEILFPDDLPRLVLRRERVELLIPAESPLAGHATVPSDALRGERIAFLGSNHGQAVIEPIRRLLETAGADAIVPPEPHAIGVERYARQFRIPAISLGWFQTGRADDDMVRRPIEGFSHATDLSLVHSPGNLSGDAALLWKHGAALFEGLTD
jgi:DNA-binding transcriptional LysR family regulator